MRRAIALPLMATLAVGCGAGDTTAPTGQAASAPTASLITPHSGQTTGAMPITILGGNFVSGATVTFGGTPATNVVVTSASITATTPAHAAGTVDIVVTNLDGQSGTLTRGFIYADLKGSWSGTTSGALPYSFTIDSTNSIRALSYDFVVQGGGGCTATGTVSGNGALADASGMSFIYNIPNDSTAGTFSSTTNATGTFKVTTTAACVGTTAGTWSAVKH